MTRQCEDQARILKNLEKVKAILKMTMGKMGKLELDELKKADEKANIEIEMLVEECSQIADVWGWKQPFGGMASE